MASPLASPSSALNTSPRLSPSSSSRRSSGIPSTLGLLSESVSVSPPSSPITKRCGRRKPSRLGESQLDPAKGNDDDDDVPEVVARFFDGTPLTPLKQREIYASFDEHATLSCSGLPDGETFVIKGKGHIVSAARQLHDSFPDLTIGRFCDPAAGISSPKLMRDGAWTATVTWSGTNNGTPYAPPGRSDLAPIAKTSKHYVRTERCKFWLGADGKVTRQELETLNGTPAGPPGVYIELGGSMPPAPTAELRQPAPTATRPPPRPAKRAEVAHE